MSRLVDLWEGSPVIPIDGHGLLLGEATETAFQSETFAGGLTALATAKRIGTLGMNDRTVAEMIVRLPDNQDFVVNVVKWTRLHAALADDTLLTGNATAVEAYDRDGSAAYVLVGRTDTNQVLVQQGSGYTHDGALTVATRLTRMSGGLLDRMANNIGARHLICMQADHATQPAHPAGIHYNGVAPSATVGSDGVTWYPSGARAVQTNPKTWFAFGEAKLDPVSGLWEVTDTWHLVDSTDSYAADYGASWGGPTWAHPYVVGTHHYARLRLPTGDRIIRRVGVSGGALDRDWIPLSEQWVGGSNYRAEPYTARTFFDLYPEDFQFVKFQWDWNAYQSVIDGVTHRSRVEAVMAAESLVASPEQARLSTQWATRRNGPVIVLTCERNYGMRIARSPAVTGSGGSTDSFRMTMQFEGGTNGELPITHARFIERQHASTQGWLRTFVL